MITEKDTRAKPAGTCPTCGGKLEIYKGDNRHKQGTGFCAKDGARVQL